MLQTRSDLLLKVSDDLERARKMTKEPNFKIQEMKDLLAGKDIDIEEDLEPFDSINKLHENLVPATEGRNQS